MWDLYRFDVEDVFTGRRAPEWAWGLMDRLVDEPRSRWNAKRIGGEKWREHIGWGPAEYLAALLADSQAVAISVADAARVGKKPKVPTPVSRPTFKDQDPEQVSDEEALALIRELDM